MSVSFLDPELLMTAAFSYYRLGLFPVPGRAGKRPAVHKWSGWARKARSGERPPWQDVERSFGQSEASAVGHLLLAGSCVLDVDGNVGEKALAGKEMPQTPCVLTTRGRHLYFAGPEDLPSYVSLAPELDMLGPGHYAELPPSAGKEWLRHLDGTLALL